MTLSKWPLFFRQCLLRRTSGEDFAELLATMYARNKITGPALISLILKCNANFCAPHDPLVPIYIQKVLSLALADVSDVLLVLIHHWNTLSKGDDGNISDNKWLEDDSSLVNNLNVAVATEIFTLSTKEARKSLVLCARWFASVAVWVSRDASRSSDQAVMSLVESCGTLLITIASSTVGMGTLDQKHADKLAKQSEPIASIQKAILTSLPLLPTASQALHLRLEAVLRHISQPRNDDNHQLTQQTALHFAGAVIDGPSVASRASLYLYLCSLRCRCVTINDSRLLSFLNARHAGDHATMFSDLVTASFNVLQRSHSRQSNQSSLDRWCSYVVNKMPSLLSVISASSFGSFSTEDCLRDVLQSINTDFTSPYLSTSLSVVKTKFLQVCSSYRLLTSSSVSMIIGTPEVDLGHSPTLYAKDDLASQIKSSHSRGIKLLMDIRNQDGNAANIVGAVVDAIHGYCQNKETLVLKELASVMLRQPALIDIVSIYIPPARFLSPMCRLLDEWAWDDLHGEGQPLYEEFGSILLLVVAFKYRLSLSDSDVGLPNESPFVFSFLQGTNDEQYLDSMTEDVKKHLGEWINALFIAEGLSDEVMSSCSPQDFYRLIPTLLSQSLSACESGKLAIDSLVSGFEYLLEPFLLPSLIPAITWLMSSASARHNQQYVRQLLETLLKEPGSNEARELHRTILGIVASNVGAITNPDSTSLATTISKYADFQSTVTADMQEVRSWVALPAGAMAHVEHILSASLSWALTQPNLVPPPTSGYTQVAVALEIYGAKVLLQQLIRFLPKFYNSMDHSAALDLVATVIIALDEGSPTKRLAEALAVEAQNLLPRLRKNEILLAEEIVRFTRRVEVLSMVVVQEDIQMDDVVTTLMPALTDADMQNVQSFTDPSANVPASQQEDAPQDIDQMLDAAAAMGNLGQENGNAGGNMDDMYLDLDTEDMDLGNFDDLDMEGMF